MPAIFFAEFSLIRRGLRGAVCGYSRFRRSASAAGRCTVSLLLFAVAAAPALIPLANSSARSTGAAVYTLSACGTSTGRRSTVLLARLTDQLARIGTRLDFQIAYS